MSWMVFRHFKSSQFICVGCVNQILKYNREYTFYYYLLFSCVIQNFVIVSQQIWF
jgi:hypothetical protein